MLSSDRGRLLSRWWVYRRCGDSDPRRGAVAHVLLDLLVLQLGFLVAGAGGRGHFAGRLGTGGPPHVRG